MIKDWKKTQGKLDWVNHKTKKILWISKYLKNPNGDWSYNVNIYSDKNRRIDEQLGGIDTTKSKAITLAKKFMEKH